MVLGLHLQPPETIIKRKLANVKWMHICMEAMIFTYIFSPWNTAATTHSAFIVCCFATERHKSKLHEILNLYTRTSIFFMQCGNKSLISSWTGAASHLFARLPSLPELPSSSPDGSSSSDGSSCSDGPSSSDSSSPERYNHSPRWNNLFDLVATN